VVVECSICGRKAVYVNRVNGKAYCKKHFLEYFDRKVRRTIRKYRMFGKHENIVVAVSGGKDSLSLLHYLHGLSKKVPGWKIQALLIDEGIKGYREVTVKDFKRLVEELGVEYRIASFKEYIGYTLDEIVRIGRERGLPYLPCSYCGVFRRYLLNKVAREMGGTVLATAHNLDDIVQTYLMNVINNSWDKIVRLGPVSGTVSHPKFIRRVEPFYEILEKETTLYSIINGFYPEFVECPYAPMNIRWKIRKMLNELEDKYPGTKYSLLRSLLSIIRILREKAGIGEGEIKTCRICGEPSAHEICRACLYRIELGILKPPPYLEEIVRRMSRYYKPGRM
jgi:uncharacterized protein (TIGR00269 family)